MLIMYSGVSETIDSALLNGDWIKGISSRRLQYAGYDNDGDLDLIVK